MGILARKGDQEKEFTETAWKILGKNKNGWEQVSNSVAKNIKDPAKKPDAGTKEKVDKPTAQTAENLADKKVEDKGESDSSNVTVDVKAEFVKAVKSGNITKNQIKDYLDTKEKQYKAGDSLDSLIELLYTELNGDIAEATKLFF